MESLTVVSGMKSKDSTGKSEKRPQQKHTTELWPLHSYRGLEIGCESSKFSYRFMDDYTKAQQKNGF